MGQKNSMEVVRLRLRFTEDSAKIQPKSKMCFILNGVKSKNKVKMKAQWTEKI